jgi:hypothetical protein
MCSRLISPELSLMAQKFGERPEPVEGFLVHVHAHAAGIIVEHHRQVRRAVDGQRMQRDLAARRVGIGRGGDQQRVGAARLGSFGEDDGILGADGAGADDQRQAARSDPASRVHHMDAFFGGLGVVLAGGARHDDPVHAGADQMFDLFGESNPRRSRNPRDRA